jgi:hypothetical protein
MLCRHSHESMPVGRAVPAIIQVDAVRRFADFAITVIESTFVDSIIAVDFGNPVIARFVAVYGAEFGRGACAEIDPLLMMRPPRGDVLPSPRLEGPTEVRWS